MLKIKRIEFNKTVYDESVSHHIFSTANVFFSNAEPIHGALLYWQQNTSSDEYTEDGDYKFYYEMAQVEFFAAVKFPADITLSAEERKELAYILLEERGSIGSYSLETSTDTLEKLQTKRNLSQFKFPAHFTINDFKDPYAFQFEDVPELSRRYRNYDITFANSYLQWRKQATQFHPDEITAYMPYISFSYICYCNPHLSEMYLIEHLHSIDWSALQSNLSALGRVSTPFKRHMLENLRTKNIPFEGDIKQDPEGFVLYDNFFFGDGHPRIPHNYEQPETPEYTLFEYDLGPYKWQGAEHLVKGIPSLASQMYDPYGYKKRTNQEMDAVMQTFSATQIRLFSAMADLHWLHRYRENIHWETASAYNPNFTDGFLIEHENYLSFKDLANNMRCHVSENYLIEHMGNFKETHPAPLILRHLTKKIFDLYQHELKLDLDLLYDYYEFIDKKDFGLIFDLLSQ